MPQDPPASGGGGAIYKDGSSVELELQTGESVTIPSGESWYVSVFFIEGNSNQTSSLTLDGITLETSSGESFVLRDLLLKDGNTLSTQNPNDSQSKAIINGWSV